MKNLFIKLLVTLASFFALVLPAQAIDYFVGANRGECAAYIVKMNTMMGYPNPATKTTTYSKIKDHKGDGKAGQCMVIISEVWSPKLKREALISDIDAASTVQERTTKRKSRVELESAGAFPIDLEP